MDFNKTQQTGNPSLNSTLQSSNQQMMKGQKYAGNGVPNAQNKKANHSIDLGGRAAPNNIAQNMMAAKNNQ